MPSLNMMGERRTREEMEKGDKRLSEGWKHEKQMLKEEGQRRGLCWSGIEIPEQEL